MTQAAHPVTLSVSRDDTPFPMLVRRLAAAGLGVQWSRQPDDSDLIILGVANGKSSLALSAGGQACWHYEPAAGPLGSPVAMTAIIGFLLGVPHVIASPAAYRAFPFKGKVGRMLQDRGLTVTLRVSEDWESFEATTEIDITSPVNPWLGTVTLADDAALDWCCDWRAAFHGNAAALIDVITPILRGSAGH